MNQQSDVSRTTRPTVQQVAAQMRMERIERLLRELEYEVTRGMMEREIEEEISFRFIIPVSRRVPGGIVGCEFRTRPGQTYEAAYYGLHEAPKLKIVGESDG